MKPMILARCLVFVLLVSTASLASAEQASELRKKLSDPAPDVRKQAALTLAEANDAEAVPVLIDLLAELPAAERRPIEEFLTALAGEWGPAGKLESEDRIARRIHRDAWMAWWQNSDGSALLALLREHTLTPELRRKIERDISKLGDDVYSTREAAADQLLHFGRAALPQLREATRDNDLEIGLRARLVIERIELQPALRLPSVAFRLLALRKPPGAAEALLAYLPLAEEEKLTEEVKNALTLLARRGGKLEAALVRAAQAKSETPLPLTGAMRALVTEALVRGGGKDGCAAVRPLLKDTDPNVRLRVALSLVMTGEKESVPVLIDLVAAASDDQIGQIEDVLSQLAGESTPETPWSTKQEDKKNRRDAWAAWWKANAADVKLSVLRSRPWYNYTLLCDNSRSRVFEIDRHGKERWAIEGVPFPVDAWMVNGNRVLIAEYGGRKVTERDLQGKILWSKTVPGQPVNVQRLSNGHTFIASLNQLVEVDRAGKEMYAINMGRNVTAAYRARDGRIVCLASIGRNAVQCIHMDTSGKHLSQFAADRDGGWTSGIDLLSNGHILITQPNRQKVTEYDRNGKRIVEVNAPQATTATGLPNGNFLIASNANRCAYEVDRSGKVVWEYKTKGSIFRARRR